MEPTFENTVKANKKLREAALKNPALKDAFAASMYAVKDLLANHFKEYEVERKLCTVFPCSTRRKNPALRWSNSAEN